MSRVKCLYCDHPISLDAEEVLDVGEAIDCEMCGAEMEIAESDPLKLKSPE